MALGRGLGELLGEIETAYDNGNENTKQNNVNLININDIKVNPYQPRKIFNEEKLLELRDSIEEHGLLQPIVVTKSDNTYILIAGERRLRASKLANKESIESIILNVEDKKLRELALIENIQRDDLNIIEIAYSYAGLINDFKMTHEELAKIVSKSRSSVTNILRLLTLSNYTQQMIGANKLTLGHAKVIIGLTEDDEKLIVDSIIGQKLSVRETENLVKKIKNNKNIDKKDLKKENSNYQLPLSLKNKLSNDNLTATLDKNYFKIKINSQEDIEKIVNYFKNI
ncbi:MAG: ParB/RepB/Spo0J family partition protein [Campylobacterota bacterium]|nr:ParB/RepB/Spo0J family partition protein [Campylobacterota bacterium]